MIIWSRWGILVVPFVGIGIALGFGIGAAFGSPGSGAGAGVFVGLGLILAAALLFVVVRLVVGKVIDKPYQAVITEKLAEPVPDANGVLKHYRSVPVLHPETGQPIWQRPVSTLFFIPVAFWPFVLAGIGLIVFVANLLTVIVVG